MTRAMVISETIVVTVPFRIVKRGGRREMQLPEGVRPDQKADNTLLKALARAFRWKRLLESGDFATIGDLAAMEGIAASYMTRVMRLTLFAPEIVERTLDGRQGAEMTLAGMLEPVALERKQQHQVFHPP